MSRIANSMLESPSLLAFLRARASIGSDRSVHSTDAALSAAARENFPVPAAQSSTRAPAGTNAPTRAAAQPYALALLLSARS